ncbi:hypothetical protein [Streptomyces umbrinus]|uniref:hypothetical protein n=1 Tax=Streptomyces umbrinus TaxID=67370 RepID=UPI0033CF14A2
MWILFGDNLPRRTEATGMMRRFYELSDQVGPAAVTASATFAAYLVGGVLQISAGNAILSRIDMRYERLVAKPGIRLSRVVQGHHLTAPVFDQLEFAAKRIVDPESDPESIPKRFLETQSIQLSRRVISQLDQLGTRLHAANVELYEDHDRLAAESNLRINMAVATTILYIALSIQISPWFCCGMVISVALLRRGQVRNRQANDVLIQALLIGVISSPAFEEARMVAEAQDHLGGQSNLD